MDNNLQHNSKYKWLKFITEIEKTRFGLFLITILILVIFITPLLCCLVSINHIGFVSVFWYSLTKILFWSYNIISLFFFSKVVCFKQDKDFSDKENEDILRLFEAFLMCFLIGTYIFGIGIVFIFYYFNYTILRTLSFVSTFILLILFFNKVNFIANIEGRKNINYQIKKGIIIPLLMFLYSFFTIGVASQMYSLQKYVETFDIIEKVTSKDTKNVTVYYFNIDLEKSEKKMFPFNKLKVPKYFFEAKEVNDKLIIYYRKGPFGMNFLVKYE